MVFNFAHCKLNPPLTLRFSKQVNKFKLGLDK